MNANELNGKALQWAVAKCLGYVGAPNWMVRQAAGFTIDWSEGGPIIHAERITIDASQHGTLWVARKGAHEAIGSTPLIAAMRVFVAATLGDNIEVPDELQPWAEKQTVGA